MVKTDTATGLGLETLNPALSIGDKDLLHFLRADVEGRLPAIISRSPNDPFGLTEHLDVHGAAAEHVYGQLSYISNLFFAGNSDTRHALVKTGRAMLPEVALGEFVRLQLSVSHDEDTGLNSYHLVRNDTGQPDGGFSVLPRPNGKIIIRSDLEDDTDTEKLIQAASKAIAVYAFKLGLEPSVLKSFQHIDHLSSGRMRELSQQVHTEHTFRYKAARRVKHLGKKAAKQAFTLISVPDTVFPEKRILSRRRLAALVLVLPIPGYSEGFFNSPVLRPAVVELGADTLNAVVAESYQPSQTQTYNARNIDLTNAQRLVVGQTKAVSFIESLPESANDVTQTEFGLTAALETGELNGTSPQRVVIKQSLRPDESIRLPISSKLRGRELFFGGTDPDVAKLVSAQAGSSSIVITNISGRILTSTDLSSFWFDSSMKTDN